MRKLHQACLVFKLNDIYTRAPVTNAVILCNGKQNPYNRKPDGHYVFSNLYPQEYFINIFCSGYADMVFKVNLRENETIVMDLDMSYTVTNPKLSRLTRFEIRCLKGKKTLGGLEFDLIPKKEVPNLKLSGPLESGSDEIKLNADLSETLLGQKYIYKLKRQEVPLTLWSYDNEKKCYILKNPVNIKLELGGKFYPVWHIKTDTKGRAIMPYIAHLMGNGEMKFELIAENIKANIKIDITDEEQSGKNFYVDAKFKEIEN